VVERQIAETRFRELLESAPDAVVLVDTQGKIKLVNRRTAELFGYEARELIDREVELLVPNRFRVGHLPHRAGYVANPRTREMGAGLELYGRRRDGSEFPVEISLSPMQAEGDEMVIAIVRDVSERRAAERERMELGLEQAALRRVATLIARSVPAEELFAAVTEEVGRLLDVDHAHLGRYESNNMIAILADSSSGGDPFPVGGLWSLVGENLSSQVAQTGRSARIDDYSDASGPIAVASAERGLRSGIGTPIVVEGHIWGVMVVGSTREQPLPADTEARLAAFTELVATAIANAESRAGVTRLADEQAALRRVATLVARGVPAREVFDAVASETKRIFEFDTATLLRLEPDGFVTTAASVATLPLLTAVGDRRTPLAGGPVDRVLRTGRPARIDGFEGEPGSPGDQLNAHGYGGAAAAPIFVEGHLWGVLRAAWSKERSVPLGSEDRLLQFSELIATALANAEAREELRRVADEQTALRRVATLVAEAAPPADVFAAVAEEVGRLLAVDAAAVRRYLPDDIAEILAQWSGRGEFIPVGPPARSVRGTVTATVRETGRPARVDRYTDEAGGAAREIGIRSAVGVPITVEGELWGLIAVVSTSEEPPPPGTEERLAAFTELVAAAIANAQAREELRTIADEQAALGRVATLVAQGEAPAVVFDAVAEQLGRLLSTDDAVVIRFEPDESVTIVASWTATGEPLPVGHRRHVEPGHGLTPLVRETGRPERIDSQTGYKSQLGLESAVAAPITVEGRIWGVVAVALRGDELAPPETEERLAAFTGIVATAIANADSREQLVASRARIVTAAAEERGRVVRDLHDGAQQHLVHALVTLKLARAALTKSDTDAGKLLDDALQQAEDANLELRELARGIVPGALRRGGLRAGAEAIVSRMPLPVRLDVTEERFPEGVESTAYFVMSEALTNVTKHAHATSAQAMARVEGALLRVEIVDDGVGGLRRTGISGLTGLEDRVSALHGSFLVESPLGQGTRVCALLPLPDRD